MGLLRDRVLARSFGAGPALDAYNSAVILPELLLDIVVAGGVQAALVPLFTRLRRDDERAAQAFGRTVIWVGVAAMVVVAVGLLRRRAVAGRAGRARLRCRRPRPVRHGAAAGGRSRRRSSPPRSRSGNCSWRIAASSATGSRPSSTTAGSPAARSCSPTASAWSPRRSARSSGSALHLAIRLWDLRATGLGVRPAFAVRTRAFREFLVLMLPKMVGEPIDPLTRLVATAIASTLASGSVTAVIFAWNFESGAVSIVGLAFSVVAFPALAAAAADGDRRPFPGHGRSCRVGHRDALQRGRDPDGPCSRDRSSASSWAAGPSTRRPWPRRPPS